MYESPIQILQNEFQKQIEIQMENGVMKAVAQCGYQVNVNKEELFRALQYDRDQYEKGYVDAAMKYDKVILKILEKITPLIEICGGCPCYNECLKDGNSYLTGEKDCIQKLMEWGMKDE